MKDDYEIRRQQIAKQVQDKIDAKYPLHAQFRKAEKRVAEFQRVVDALKEEGWVILPTARPLPDGSFYHCRLYAAFRAVLGIDNAQFDAEQVAMEVDRDQQYQKLVEDGLINEEQQLG